jgi:hypothetical protein
VENNTNFIGPHKTTVAVATLLVVQLTVREWLLHCIGHFLQCVVSRQQQNAAGTADSY